MTSRGIFHFQIWKAVVPNPNREREGKSVGGNTNDHKPATCYVRLVSSLILLRHRKNSCLISVDRCKLSRRAPPLLGIWYFFLESIWNKYSRVVNTHVSLFEYCTVVRRGFSGNRSMTCFLPLSKNCILHEFEGEFLIEKKNIILMS